MKLLALSIVVLGWMAAVAGPVLTDEVAVRMALAVIGLGGSLGGILLLNHAHLEHAIWKGGR